MTDDISKQIIQKYPPPKRGKAFRRNKRISVGYDESEPEMCQNCKYFAASLHSNGTSEYFPPRCIKHEFQVIRFAICDEWSDLDE